MADIDNRIKRYLQQYYFVCAQSSFVILANNDQLYSNRRA